MSREPPVDQHCPRTAENSDCCEQSVERERSERERGDGADNQRSADTRQQNAGELRSTSYVTDRRAEDARGEKLQWRPREAEPRNDPEQDDSTEDTEPGRRSSIDSSTAAK